MKKFVFFLLTVIILMCLVFLVGNWTGHPVTDFFDSFDADKVLDRSSSGGDGTAGEDEYLKLAAEYDFAKDKYPYLYMLSESGRKAYYILYDGISNGRKTIELNEDLQVHKSEVMTIVEAVYCDHPELFWFDSGATYSYDESTGIVVEIKPQYNSLIDELSSAKIKFKANADEILSRARRLSDDRILSKEAYVHDCLCEVCEYDATAENHQSAYSCLVEGTSVCSGYARAFQYLMQQLDVPVYFVTGDIIGGNAHAWNIIVIGGKYYNVDVTWDDEVGRQLGESSHPYFNVTDNAVSATHRRKGMSADLPQCTSEDMSYDKKIGYTITIDQIKRVPDT